MVSQKRNSTFFFNKLFSEHQRSVYRFAFYLAQNCDEADELFQETWLKVVHHLPKIGRVKNPPI